MLLWADGFDDYDYDASFAADCFSGEYETYLDENSASSSISIAAGEGRRSTNGAKFTGTNSNIFSYFQKTIPPRSELFVAVATKIPGIGGGLVGGTLCTFMSNALRQVVLCVTKDGAIEARRNITQIGITANNVIADTNFHHYQIHVVFHDSAGVVQVKVDGSSTAILNLSGVDTNNGGGEVANRVRIGYAGGTTADAAQPDQVFDDFVIWDTEPGLMTTWAGDLRVDTYFPNGEGFTQDFATSSGSAHYSLVDEASPDNSDYVESEAKNDVELFTFEDMTHSPGTIYGAVVTAKALADDEGSCSIDFAMRSGGVTTLNGLELDVVEAAVFATGARREYAIFETDSGTVWTKATFNAAQAGVKRVI